MTVVKSNFKIEYLYEFTVVTWNMRGHTSKDTQIKQAKQQMLKYIQYIIQPDILNLLEYKVHYNQITKQITLPELKGYFCKIGQKHLCDNKVKTLTYYKKRYKGLVKKIEIKRKIPKQKHLEHNHYCTWSILLNAPHSPLQHSIINGCYYRSGKAGNKDIKNINAT